MKKSFLYLLAVTAFTATFTSCSNDDEPIVPGVSLEEKAYASQNLDLSLNGSNLVGKKVTFTPDGNGNANITLAGEPLNLSDLIGGMTKADSATEGLSIPTAGVLPGSPSVVIPVKLEGEADSCTCKGTGETDFCTYSYSGYATPENFKFDLSDVKLKNTSLAGTWTIHPLKVDDEDGSEYPFNTLHVDWVSEKGIDLFGTGYPMPVADLLGLTLVYPFLPAIDNDSTTTSIVDALCQVVKSIDLGEDGSVSAKYLDTKVEGLPETVAPKGIAQYIISKEGQLRLFLDPAAIIANTLNNATERTRAVDLSSLVEGLMQNLLPMLTAGIPIEYGQAQYTKDGKVVTIENTTAFYLGTETLLPILKIAKPLFSDEDFVKSIVEEASKDPNMGIMAMMLPGILNAIPEIIDTTSKVEIGINLTKN